MCLATFTLPGKVLNMTTGIMNIQLNAMIFPGVDKQDNYLHTAHKQDY